MNQTICINNVDALRAIFFAYIRNKFIWGICIILGSPEFLVTLVGLWAMEFPIIDTITTTFNYITWVLTLNLIGYIISVISLILNPKWRKGRIGEHQITINTDGFIEETEYNKKELKWASISNINTTNSLIFIQHSGGEIDVIPKRSFSDKEWECFVTYTNNIWLKVKDA